MSDTIVNLDPVAQNKKKGWLAKLLVTTWHGGNSVKKTDPFGHYMFCGPQRSGKTASALWYAEYLIRKHAQPNIVRRKLFKKKPVKVRLWSNIGVGTRFNRNELPALIDNLDPNTDEVRIFIVDEIHGYFPKDGNLPKEVKLLQTQLLVIFSQLAKRNCYVISTAQIYGRLDKSLREQCLFMINCKVSINRRLVNEFIPQENIVADDLGRWSGDPSRIMVHGLSILQYDTKRLIRE